MLQHLLSDVSIHPAKHCEMRERERECVNELNYAQQTYGHENLIHFLNKYYNYVVKCCLCALRSYFVRRPNHTTPAFKRVENRISVGTAPLSCHKRRRSQNLKRTFAVSSLSSLLSKKTIWFDRLKFVTHLGLIGANIAQSKPTHVLSLRFHCLIYFCSFHGRSTTTAFRISENNILEIEN